MICGVGINDMPKGWCSKRKWNNLVYRKWRSMLMRCYSEKYQKTHPTYKCCTVCERWLLLSNFVEDFPKVDGYNEEKFLNGELVLDKDIKSNGKNKEYSLDNCMLVSAIENAKQAIKTTEYLRGKDSPRYGKTLSKETKQKISNKTKGENNPMFGKHHSKESKQKMSIKKQGKNHPQARKIAQYDKERNFIKIWNCMMDVQIELGIKHSNICECCRGKRKTAGGYIWKYVEEE